MRVDPKCPLCENHYPTIHHILSNCPTALLQGRYTWRRDSALKTLAEARVLADLPTLRAAENPPSTIPPEILDTSA